MRDARAIVSVFLLNLSTSYAQIGPSPAATNTPNYGIYGTAPTPASTPFPCGTPRYANLKNYPEVEGGLDYTLPLNGLKNFNFYYTADGLGFLSGGGYRVTYLNVSGTNCYGNGDIVTYSPNRGHTNGVQVRPFNLGGYTTPRGIHGYVLAKIPGGGGATAALENAVASISFPYDPAKAKTNGVGYFSIYYDIYSSYGFLPSPPNSYNAHISGTYSGCPYSWTDPVGIVWLAYYGDPDNPNYAVYNAEGDLGTITLTSTSPGACQP